MRRYIFKIEMILFFLTFFFMLNNNIVHAEENSMYKLKPKYLITNNNFDMSSATVTTDENNFFNSGNFRTNKDLAGMIWESEDFYSHSATKYSTNPDFTGVKLKYNYSISGYTELLNSGNSPALTIETNDGYIYYIRLWNYVVDRPLDYWESEISNIVGTNIRFPEDRTVGEATGAVGTIEIDFDNLYAGWSPFEFDGINWYENPYWGKVPVNNIKSIMWSFIPKDYNFQDNQPSYLPDSKEYKYEFNNWEVIGNIKLDKQTPENINNGLSISDDYDDSYYLTPERIVDEYKELGYKGNVNFYVGASHYYDKKYNGIKMEIKTDYVFNEAFESWYLDYMNRLKNNDMGLINSISMENVDAPEEWWQRTWDNKPACTLWTPTPYLLSFTNENVKDFYEKYVIKLADMASSTGLTPIVQLGEPWWWYTETDPNKPPCFYDNSTRELYKKETGKEMFEFKSGNEPIEGKEDMLNWLKNKNGEFSLLLRDSIKSKYENAQFTVLFFTPSVIDIERVPRMMSIVNTPEQWKYPNLDFFMLEDYDYLIDNKWDKHFETLDYVQENFGYSSDKIDYLCGFVLNENYGYVWNNIDQAINDGINKKFRNVYIWAAPQVKAWSWKNPDIINVNFPSGIYNNQLEVTLSTLSGSEIKYTVDGSDPLEEGKVYAEPIKIKNTTVIRARVTKGENKGNEVVFSYGINYFGPDSYFGKEGVNEATGNYSKSFEDMNIKSKGIELSFSRVYNSLNNSSNTVFGRGWNFGLESEIKDYEASIIYADGSVGKIPSSEIKEVILPDGSVKHFMINSDKKTYKALDSRNTLNLLEAGTKINNKDVKFELISNEQFKYYFSKDGFLTFVMDKYGNKIEIDVDVSGKITEVRDEVGRRYLIEYENNLITSIVDIDENRKLSYTYENGNLTKFTDSVGAVTTYKYDLNNRLIEIKKENTNSETISYINDGENKNKVDSIKDIFGNEKRYTYDNIVGKTIITDTNGRTENSWYDKILSTTHKIDSEGRVSYIEYYKSMNGMNEYGEEKSIVDRNGNKTEYIRDNLGNIIKQINPDSTFKEFKYDNKNNLILEIDEVGKKTFYIYDNNNIYLNKKIQPINGIDEYVGTDDENKFAITKYEYYKNNEYKINGLKKSVTDPEGNLTKYEYYDDGELYSETDSKGNVTKYEYSILIDKDTSLKDYKEGEITNNKVSIDNSKSILQWRKVTVTPNNHKIEEIFDKNGQLIKTIGENGQVNRKIYDNNGNLIQEISPESYDENKDDIDNNIYNDESGTIYYYNKINKVSKFKDSENNITNFNEYDLYGNVIKETKPNGAIYRYEYDSQNRIIKIFFQEDEYKSEILLQKNNFEILADGKSKKIESKILDSSESSNTEYIYDFSNKLLEIINSDGSKISNTYEMNGLVSSETSLNKATTFYKYDGLNRLNEKWTPIESKNNIIYYSYYNVEYNKIGQKIVERFGIDKVEKNNKPNNYVEENYFYDKGSLLYEINSNGDRIDYTYDAEENVIKKVIKIDEDQTGKPINKVIEYDYNDINKVISEKQYINKADLDGNPLNDSQEDILISSYHYNKNGKIDKYIDANGLEISYFYDKLERETGSSRKSLNENGEEVLVSESRKYNWDDKIIEEIDYNGNMTLYNYNKQNSLIEKVYPNGSKDVYFYDIGQRKIAEVSAKNYSLEAKLDQMSRIEYVYDLMDRIKLVKNIYNDNVSNYEIIEKAYKYDNSGNVIKEIDSLAYYDSNGDGIEEKINNSLGIEKTYDLNNNLTSVLYPETKKLGYEFTVKYDYDGLGRKITESNAKEQDIDYYYDNDGNIQTDNNEKGKIIRFEYDDDGNNIAIYTKEDDTSNERVISKSTYNNIGNLKSSVDSKGVVTNYDYNNFDKVRSITYSGDNTIDTYTINFQYDKVGRLKKKIDSLNVIESYSYDSFDRKIEWSIKKSDGTEEASNIIRYDNNGNKKYIIDANNNTIELKYDDSNRVISTKQMVTNINGDMTNHITTYQYDLDGKVINEVDWLGNSNRKVYDPFGRLIEEKNSNGITTKKIEYNSNGKESRIYDALNNYTEYNYDMDNRLISETDPEGRVISTKYDLFGNVIEKTDGNEEHITRYGYDVFNNLKWVEGAEGDVTLYKYDENNNLILIKDANGNETKYEYNVANKASKLISSNNYIENYKYLPNGLMKSKVDSNNITTNYEYDIRGRNTSLQAGGIEYKYSYDGNGNLISYSDAKGTTTQIFDELNRLIKKVTPYSEDISYNYDTPNTNFIGYKDDTLSDSKGNIVTKTFDNDGRLVRVSSGIDYAEYSYQNNDKISTVSYKNGMKEEYKYNKDNTIKTLINRNSDNSIINSFNYIYDDSKNITSIEDSIGITQFSYDKMNRIKSVLEPLSDGVKKEISYSYDNVGNRVGERSDKENETINKRYSYDSNNLLTNIDTEENGDLLEKWSFEYDKNGNQIKYKIDNYDKGILQHSLLGENRYDELNQLIESKTPDEVVVNNTYNAIGYRTAKSVNGQVTNYLYDKDKVILELDNNLNVKANNIYGINLAIRKDNNNSLYYMYNGHGDVINIYDAQMKEAASYRYDIFGNAVFEDEKVENNYRYSGYQYDRETNLYYLNARMYDSNLGRFLQRDSYTGSINDPSSLNIYVYCVNNPLIYDDPTGHFLHVIAGAGIGAAVGIIGNAVFDYLDDGKFNSGLKSYFGAAAEGAISGALAAATGGVSLIAQIALEGTSGFVGNAINQYVSTGKINWNESVTSGVFSAIIPVAGNKVASIVNKSSFAKGVKKSASEFASGIGNKISSVGIGNKIQQTVSKTFNSLSKSLGNVFENKSQYSMSNGIRVSLNQFDNQADNIGAKVASKNSIQENYLKVINETSNISTNKIEGKISSATKGVSKADNFTTIRKVTAEETNSWWKNVMGYDNPPYKPGTMVEKIKLTKDTTFVRVYDGEVSGMYGGWVMKAEDIAGLTPKQIQDKFALPSLPKYMADVKLTEGTTIRKGIVNPLEGWGNGGGIQYDLMGQRVGEFLNPRELP